MEFEIGGEKTKPVIVDASRQADRNLVSAAQEIAAVAASRGLDLSFVKTTSGDNVSDNQLSLDDEPLTYTKETIIEELPFAFEAYEEVMELLRYASKKEDEYKDSADIEAVEQELREWLTDERIGHIQAYQEANPGVRFTLVATPNVALSKHALMVLHNKFGQGYAEIDKKYRPKDLAGTNPDNGKAIQFSLVPDTLDKRFNLNKTEGRKRLEEFIRQFPLFRGPSVLEYETYVRTLRAKTTDGNLGGEGTKDKTYMYFFDLKQRATLSPLTAYVSDSGYHARDNESIIEPVWAFSIIDGHKEYGRPVIG